MITHTAIFAAASRPKIICAIDCTIIDVTKCQN